MINRMRESTWGPLTWSVTCDKCHSREALKVQNATAPLPPGWGTYTVRGERQDVCPACLATKAMEIDQ